MSRIAGLTLAGLLVVVGMAPAPAADNDPVATITDSRIPESSALVQSTVDPDLAYTINDSGNDTVVYVIELDTGDVVGTTSLDVDGEDTEAMAIGPDGRLYVGDIGDNRDERRQVALYALDQPARGDATVTPEVYQVRYTDGPSNAETLLADPVTGQLSIVTKELLAGSVYRLPNPLHADRVNLARPLRNVAVEGMVTDGAFLPDGTGVLLRTYIDVVVYTFPGWREIDRLDTPRQPQSESLAVWNDGHSVLVGTEKLPSTIYQVRVPRPDWRRLHTGPERTSDPPAAPSDPAASGQVDDSRGWTIATAVGVVLLGSAWLWVRRRRP